MAAPAAREVKRFIEDTMGVLGAPGAMICVMRDGGVVWSRAFGMADLEQQVPVTAETKFRIGSVSKSLTSVAIGKLVEDGLLDLDAPVQRYVPRFPVKRYPITVGQVAGHLAGIRHYLTGEFENQVHYGSPTEGLAMFAADSLLFEPGTRFEYSSHGYVLLAAVIEGASGRPYLEYMHEAVLGPAGMTHTAAEHPDSIIPGRGRYYTRVDSTGPIVNAPYVDNTYKWASGGFLSTAEDLARFGDRLMRGSCCDRRRWNCSGPRCGPRTGRRRNTGSGGRWSGTRWGGGGCGGLLHRSRDGLELGCP